MMFLPRSAAALASLCAEEAQRYSMTGVLLQAEPQCGGFRLVATNGRLIGILRGPNCASPLDIEALDQLPELESLATQAVMPADEFKKALNSLPKPRHDRERRAGVMLGNRVIVMSAGDSVHRSASLEGRFPDHTGILPKEPACVNMMLNPHYLIDLCRVAIAVSNGGPAENQITLLYWKKDHPIGIIAEGKDGMAFDGLLMPITK